MQYKYLDRENLQCFVFNGLPHMNNSMKILHYDFILRLDITVKNNVVSKQNRSTEGYSKFNV